MGKKKRYYYKSDDRNQRQEIPFTEAHKEQNKEMPSKNVYRTPSGFRYTIIAKNLQDMRFIDALVNMQDQTLPEAERVVNMVRVIRLMMGEDQKEAFFAHIVKLHGWASPAAVGAELQAILANFDQTKKK